MPQHALLFALGLALLAAGGGLFAFGAARVARRCGANPFAVGLVAAGIGTALAALAFDLVAVSHDRMRLALGNIIGVNGATIGLALGLAVVVRPLAGSSRVAIAAIRVLLAATFLFWYLCADNSLSPVDAGALLVAFVVAVTYLVYVGDGEPAAVREQFAEPAGSLGAGLALVAGGIAALVGGAVLAVDGADQIGRAMRGGTLMLGATAAGFACSLPALATAVNASRRGRPDVALAAVIGACLFNILFVVGVTALATPLLSTEQAFLVYGPAVTRDIPAMGVVTLLLVTVLVLELEVPRWQGAVFLLAYAGFVTWQVAR